MLGRLSCSGLLITLGPGEAILHSSRADYIIASRKWDYYGREHSGEH